MNLSDPDDLRCTLSCAISVPQSLCPTAGKRHPCQCPEHHGECLLHISLFRHGIQLREDTVEGIQRRGSNVTKHHTWRRHSGPLQVLLVSNVSKAAGTTQLWSNSWRFVLQNASVSPTKPASPVAPSTKGRNVVWCAPARRSCSGRELI